MHAIDAESGLTTEAVLEHRLALAASHLGWTQPRIAAFRQGLADGRAGTVDRGRRYRHGEEDPFDESILPSALVDALGYADGVSAAEAAVARSPDFRGTEEILEEAASWADNGDGDFDVDEAEWSHSTADALAPFLAVMDRDAWIAWFGDEHRGAIEAGRPGYGNLLMEDILHPVTYVAYPEGRVDVWDGYHRIGAAMLRGSGAVPSIRGVPPAPSPRP